MLLPLFMAVLSNLEPRDSCCRALFPIPHHRLVLQSRAEIPFILSVLTRNPVLQPFESFRCCREFSPSQVKETFIFQKAVWKASLFLYPSLLLTTFPLSDTKISHLLPCFLLAVLRAVIFLALCTHAVVVRGGGGPWMSAPGKGGISADGRCRCTCACLRHVISDLACLRVNQVVRRRDVAGCGMTWGKV